VITESFEIDNLRTGTTVRVAARGELDIASAPLLDRLPLVESGTPPGG
jgi:hypothetical protein